MGARARRALAKQCDRLLGRQRPREEVALRRVASEVAEYGELSLQLHAFGDGLPRLPAGRMMVRTISRLSGLLAIRPMNERSISSASMGNRQR